MSATHYQKNKSKYISKALEWKLKNPERRKEIAKAYYRRNRDRINSKNKQRSKTIETKFSTARSHAIKKGLSWELSLDQYKNIVILNKCSYCSQNLPRTGSGLDRKNSNLGYTIYNVTPCCDKCNQLKSDLITYEEMLAVTNTLKQLRNTENIWHEQN